MSGLHLYKRLALTTLTALIGLGGAAQADMHAAGPVYAGPTAGGTIFCWVFNFGTTPVSISAAQILANNVAVPSTAGNCIVTLQTNQSCFYAAAITPNVAYSCRVVDQSTISLLSGAGEIIGTDGTVLTNLPLQNSQ